MYLIDILKEAWMLISKFDKELYGIMGLTLLLTLISTSISAALAIPAGILLGSMDFRGNGFIIKLVRTFMGLPPVIAGLVVVLVLSKKGPAGSLHLLFTPYAMVIAQIIIISPLIAGMLIEPAGAKSNDMLETCRGLALSRIKTLFLIAAECKNAVLAAVLAGYGRAVSEVGAVILAGGNIKNNTRVMTTAIVLETGKGNYDRALALGLILLVVLFIVNSLLHRLKERK